MAPVRAKHRITGLNTLVVTTEFSRDSQVRGDRSCNWLAAFCMVGAKGGPIPFWSSAGIGVGVGQNSEKERSPCFGRFSLPLPPVLPPPNKSILIIIDKSSFIYLFLVISTQMWGLSSPHRQSTVHGQSQSGAHTALMLAPGPSME